MHEIRWLQISMWSCSACRQEARENIEVNLTVIHSAINDMNVALEEDPENILCCRSDCLRTYREELALLRRVSGSDPERNA